MRRGLLIRGLLLLLSPMCRPGEVVSCVGIWEEDWAYRHHYYFGTHHSLGAVAGSFEVVLQRGEGDQPWRYAEDCPSIWDGRDTLP